MFIAGALIMAYNVWRTVRGDEPVDAAEQSLLANRPRLEFGASA
jgi:cytochrome c oxidase cbb3-type subunit 1